MIPSIFTDTCANKMCWPDFWHPVSFFISVFVVVDFGSVYGEMMGSTLPNSMANRCSVGMTTVHLSGLLLPQHWLIAEVLEARVSKAIRSPNSLSIPILLRVGMTKNMPFCVVACKSAESFFTREWNPRKKPLCMPLATYCSVCNNFGWKSKV